MRFKSKPPNLLGKDYALRQLSHQELVLPYWLSHLRDFLNSQFAAAYDQTYSADQLKTWISKCNESFVVLVKKTYFSTEYFEEEIVATVKIFPLIDDFVSRFEVFDAYNVKPAWLACNFDRAKAVWVGDLVSTNSNLLYLLMVVERKVENLSVPIYCRTIIDQLRNILLERYGATILRDKKPRPARETVLIFRPKPTKKDYGL